MEAITWQNGLMTSIVKSKEELLGEINHYQAFWLTNRGEYTNNKVVKIVVNGLTEEDRKWLSGRMR